MKLSTALYLLGLSATSAFVAPSVRPKTILRSEPSDTSDDAYYDSIIDTESETFEPTPQDRAMSSVMDLIPSELGEVSSEKRAAITEALLKLEAMNPTENPAISPLLNGVWELRYYGGYSSDFALSSPTRQLALFLYSGGYSPGIFALGLAKKLPGVELGELEIAISREQPRVEASISAKIMGGAESSVTVKARLDAQSGVRLKEVYESATILDNPFEIPQPLQYSRDLYVTYVDEDILVVRDASGIPEILVRKEKSFARNWGTEPGDVDDMSPPGES